MQGRGSMQACRWSLKVGLHSYTVFNVELWKEVRVPHLAFEVFQKEHGPTRAPMWAKQYYATLDTNVI